MELFKRTEPLKEKDLERIAKESEKNVSFSRDKGIAFRQNPGCIEILVTAKAGYIPSTLPPFLANSGRQSVALTLYFAGRKNAGIPAIEVGKTQMTIWMNQKYNEHDYWYKMDADYQELQRFAESTPLAIRCDDY